MFRTLSLAAIAAAMTTPAHAHDFWLAPSDYQMEEPGAVTMDFQVGHGTEVSPWNLRWDRLVALKSYSASGSVDHQSAIVPRTGEAPGGARITLDTPGTHIVALESYHSFSDLEAEKFNEYATSEGLSDILAHREQAGSADTNGTEIYSRRGKAIIQVGADLSDLAMEPVGHTLEIVPLAHPYGLGEDRKLPVRVLFRGEPLAGALIDLTDLETGEEPMSEARTDANGEAVFTLPEEGTFKFNVIWGWPNPGNDRAEFESIFSSLTIGVGR